MVLLVGGEKGGTGKTTLAINLAVERALEGKRSLLVDTDAQGSASFWHQLREEQGGAVKIFCVQRFGKGIAGMVKDLRKDFEAIIIDAGGRDSLELRSSLVACDLALVPLQPHQLDLWTMGRMQKLIEEASAFNQGLRSLFVVSRANTNPFLREDLDAFEFFREQGGKVADTVIYERVSYRKTTMNGLGILEQQADRKAADEMRSLAREVFSYGEV